MVDQKKKDEATPEPEAVEPAEERPSSPLDEVMSQAERAYAAYMDAERQVAKAYHENEVQVAKAYKRAEQQAARNYASNVAQALKDRDEALAKAAKARDDVITQAEGAYRVLARAQELEADGRDIIHLEIGQPDYDTYTNISQAGITAISEGQTRYNPPAGINELRQAIADDAGYRRGLKVLLDNVVVSPGAKPNLFFPTLQEEERGKFLEVS